MGRAWGRDRESGETEAAPDSLQRGPPGALQPEGAGAATAGPISRTEDPGCPEICWAALAGVLPRPDSATARKPTQNPVPRGLKEMGVEKDCGALVVRI